MKLKMLLLVVFFLLLLQTTNSAHVSLFVVTSLRGRALQVDSSGYACTSSTLLCCTSVSSCFGGLPRIAAALDAQRAIDPSIIPLVAGDTFGDTLWYTEDKGQFIMRAFDMMGFRAKSIGTTDFFLGADVFASYLGFNIQSVSSNMMAGDPDDPIASIVKPYTIVDVPLPQTSTSTSTSSSSCIRVGIVGYSSIDLCDRSSCNFRIDVFAIIPRLQAAVDAVRRNGAVVVVAFGAVDPDFEQEIAASVRGIDVVFAAEAPGYIPTQVDVKDLAGNGTSIIYTGRYGQQVGIINITLTEPSPPSLAPDVNGISATTSIVTGLRVAQINATYLTLTGSSPGNASIAALLQPQEIVANSKLSQVVGFTPSLLEGSRDIIRSIQTPLGTLVCEALRYYTRSQIGFVNGGAIRTSIRAGNITLGDVIGALPFTDPVSSFVISGEDLIAVMQNSVSRVGSSSGTGRFMQVCGMRMTYNAALPAGIRVLSLQVRNNIGNWENVAPTATYRATTTSFERRGGDEYSMLAKVPNAYDGWPSLSSLALDYIVKTSPIVPDPTLYAMPVNQTSSTLSAECSYSLTSALLNGTLRDECSDRSRFKSQVVWLLEPPVGIVTFRMTLCLPGLFKPAQESVAIEAGFRRSSTSSVVYGGAVYNTHNADLAGLVAAANVSMAAAANASVVDRMCLPLTLLAHALRVVYRSDTFRDSGGVTFSFASSTACPAGYSYDAASLKCVPCPAGTSGTLALSNEMQTADVCLPCPPGTSSKAGSAECTPCNPGSFSDESGSPECTECPAGSYQPMSFQSSCIVCPKGTFQGVSGTTACEQCPLGSSDDDSRMFCRPCNPGTFMNAEYDCELCPQGTYSSGVASTACTSCEAGYFQGREGWINCEACAINSFSNAIGSFSCQTCPGNSSTCGANGVFGCPLAANDLSDCLCVNGYFGQLAPFTDDAGFPIIISSNNSNNNNSTNNSNGNSNNLLLLNASSSVPTPPTLPPTWNQSNGVDDGSGTARGGSISPSLALHAPPSLCKPCPTGGICCNCEAINTCVRNFSSPRCNRTEFYTSIASAGADGMPCDLCSSGTFFPLARIGWISVSHVELAPKNPFVFIPCEPPEACLGGLWGECGDGYEGLRCGECSDGYFRERSGKCAVCPTSSGLRAFLAFLAIMVVVGICVFLIYDGEKMFRLSGLSITIDWLQLLSIVFSFSESWPSVLRAIQSIGNGANLNVTIFPVDCIFPTSTPQRIWLVQMFLPLILAAACSLAFLMMIFLRWKGMVSENSGYTSRSTIVNSIYLCVTLFYSAVARAALSVFRCVRPRTAPEISFLAGQPSLLCWTSEHLEYIPFACVFAPLYGLGVPVFVFYVLFRNRHRLSDMSVRRRYAALCAVYTDDSYYWNCFTMLRRLTLIFCMNVFPSERLLQMCLALVLLVFSIIFSIDRRPFIVDRANTVFVTCACQILLVVVASIVLTTSSTSSASSTAGSGVDTYSTDAPDGTVIGVSIIVVASFIFTLFFCIWFIVNEYLCYHSFRLADRSKLVAAVKRNEYLSRLFPAMNQIHWATSMHNYLRYSLLPEEDRVSVFPPEVYRELAPQLVQATIHSVAQNDLADRMLPPPLRTTFPIFQSHFPKRSQQLLREMKRLLMHHCDLRIAQLFSDSFRDMTSEQGVAGSPLSLENSQHVDMMSYNITQLIEKRSRGQQLPSMSKSEDFVSSSTSSTSPKGRRSLSGTHHLRRLNVPVEKAQGNGNYSPRSPPGSPGRVFVLRRVSSEQLEQQQHQQQQQQQQSPVLRQYRDEEDEDGFGVGAVDRAERIENGLILPRVNSFEGATLRGGKMLMADDPFTSRRVIVEDTTSLISSDNRVGEVDNDSTQHNHHNHDEMEQHQEGNLDDRDAAVSLNRDEHRDDSALSLDEHSPSSSRQSPIGTRHSGDLMLLVADQAGFDSLPAIISANSSDEMGSRASPSQHLVSLTMMKVDQVGNGGDNQLRSGLCFTHFEKDFEDEASDGVEPPPTHSAIEMQSSPLGRSAPAHPDAIAPLNVHMERMNPPPISRSNPLNLEHDLLQPPAPRRPVLRNQGSRLRIDTLPPPLLDDEGPQSLSSVSISPLDRESAQNMNLESSPSSKHAMLMENNVGVAAASDDGRESRRGGWIAGLDEDRVADGALVGGRIGEDDSQKIVGVAMTSSAIRSAATLPLDDAQTSGRQASEDVEIERRESEQVNWSFFA